MSAHCSLHSVHAILCNETPPCHYQTDHSAPAPSFVTRHSLLVALQEDVQLHGHLAAQRPAVVRRGAVGVDHVAVCNKYAAALISPGDMNIINTAEIGWLSKHADQRITLVSLSTAMDMLMRPLASQRKSGNFV